MVQVLRLYIEIFLSYGLYVFALSWKLLITGLLLEYFATLLKRLHVKKIATKCSIFLQWLYFFLMGRSRRFFFFIKTKFHQERAKGMGKMGFGWFGPKWGFFCKIPIIKWDTNFISQLLVRQTSNHHHCNLHAQKPTCRDFQVISNSSSWSKRTLCILGNRYSYQIGNAMEKIWNVMNRLCHSSWSPNI